MDTTILRRSPKVQEAYEVEKASWKSEGSNYCVFCDERRINRSLVTKGNFMYLIKNLWPYEDSREHFIIVPRRHLPEVSDFIKDEWTEWFELHKFVVRGAFKESFEFFTRGQKYPTSSVKGHIHSHIRTYR